MHVIFNAKQKAYGNINKTCISKRKQISFSASIIIVERHFIFIHVQTVGDHRRKHDDRPHSANIGFDKCLWTGDEPAILNAANKLILARSTSPFEHGQRRITACIFFFPPPFPSSPLFSFCLLSSRSRLARHSFRSIRLGARFLNIHRSRGTGFVACRVRFDEKHGTAGGAGRARS